MLNRGLIRVGFVLEFMAEFLYFIAILRPGYFTPIFAILIMLIYIESSILMYLGFNERAHSLSAGSMGAILLMLGSLLSLITYFTSTPHIITVVCMGILFLGDISISSFFWRVAQRDILVKIGAVLNAIPVITFTGSLLLAVNIDQIKDLG